MMNTKSKVAIYCRLSEEDRKTNNMKLMIVTVFKIKNPC